MRIATMIFEMTKCWIEYLKVLLSTVARILECGEMFIGSWGPKSMNYRGYRRAEDSTPENVVNFDENFCVL